MKTSQGKFWLSRSLLHVQGIISYQVNYTRSFWGDFEQRNGVVGKQVSGRKVYDERKVSCVAKITLLQGIMCILVRNMQWSFFAPTNLLLTRTQVGETTHFILTNGTHIIA